MGTKSVEFEYIKPVTVTIEKDEKGKDFIIVKITNPFIKEIKTAEKKYIEVKNEHYNPNDGTDMKEMKVSQKIDQEIHEVWKILNPGGAHGIRPGPEERMSKRR